MKKEQVKLTKEFIEKAKKIHGDRYDYSEVKYTKPISKVCITCPDHGLFSQTPNNHLKKKKGCNECEIIFNAKKEQTEATKAFIEKATKIHGDKYDYSAVKYKKPTSKVCILCHDHGLFPQTPDVHLQGEGCDECKDIVVVYNGQTKSTKEFIEKATKIHGDKYDYSAVKYKTAHLHVCIICHEHGPFCITPNNHLNKKGCRDCGIISRSKKRTKSKEEFIEKAKKVHGYKYDYSKVKYKKAKTDVCIICPEHGLFSQNPDNHLQGKGCDECGKISSSHKQRDALEDFIKKANEVHEYAYDYSNVDYQNAQTAVCIICPEHGLFSQTPNSHLRGSSCPVCANIVRGNKLRKAQDLFILQATEVHGDKYDYSKVKYKDSKEDVIIICDVHKEFKQTPSGHLSGSGCLDCGNITSGIKRRKSQEIFIKEAKKIHRDKYDYSKVKYHLGSEKVIIICDVHEEFEQSPSEHLSGRGCKDCGRIAGAEKRRKSTEQFIEIAREEHGDKYDYSQVNYIKAILKVNIKCPIHKSFWQRPHDHLRSSGCPDCGKLAAAEKRMLTQEEFVQKANKLHDYKYSYTSSVYKGFWEEITIICPNPKHGEFTQIAGGHLTGSGCQKCKSEKLADLYRLTKEEFVQKARDEHGDRYNYSLVEYVNYKEKVWIKCPDHVLFEQVAGKHLSGSGCGTCKASIGERKINDVLSRHNIDFKYEYSASYLSGIEAYDTKVGLYSFDFYILKMKLIIEFDGVQHFKPVKFSNSNKDPEGALESCKQRDQIKDEIAQQNGLNVLRIPFWEIDNIVKILSSILAQEDVCSELLEQYSFKQNQDHFHKIISKKTL